MSRVQFTEALNSLIKDPSSEVFSPTDMSCNISCLLAPKPSEPKKKIVRWQRVHDKFMISTYRGAQILYLRGKREKPARSVLSTDGNTDISIHDNSIYDISIHDNSIHRHFDTPIIRTNYLSGHNILLLV